MTAYPTTCTCCGTTLGDPRQDNGTCGFCYLACDPDVTWSTECQRSTSS